MREIKTHEWARRVNGKYHAKMRDHTVKMKSALAASWMPARRRVSQEDIEWSNWYMFDLKHWKASYYEQCRQNISPNTGGIDRSRW